MYLKLRHRTWHAFHDFPAALRPVLGKRRFVVSLNTGDYDVARQRAAILEARWLAEIARARSQSVDPVEEQARFIKKVLRGVAIEEAKGLGLEHWKRRVEEGGPAFKETKEYKDHERLLGIVSGKLVRTDERLGEYLATLDNEKKTIDMRRSTITAFAREFRYLSEIKRSAVQQWINRQAEAGRAVATINRALSEMRGYWSYLQGLELDDDDRQPFNGLQKRKGSKNAKRDQRKAFAAADLVALHKAAQASGDQALADLIALGMFTGARREELCALRIEHVNAYHFEIVDAKTSAGWRQVPIHSKLRATVARLVRDSRDDFLLSGLGANKYGKRGGGLGHRFTRLKTGHGFGTQHVFHSIRRTVATLLQNAVKRRDIIDDILGWEKPGMLGHYSEGVSLAMKRQAIEKLAYPGWRG
jgi:integrase